MPQEEKVSTSSLKKQNKTTTTITYQWVEAIAMKQFSRDRGTKHPEAKGEPEHAHDFRSVQQKICSVRPEREREKVDVIYGIGVYIYAIVKNSVSNMLL